MNQEKLNQILEQYKLSDREKIEAARRIYSWLTNGKQKSCYPTAIIVAGQPGAGKTNLAKYSASMLPDAIMLDIDDFRPFHPHYNEVIDKHPEYFAPTTNKFISEMSAIVTNWLIADEYDMILHKTFKADAVIFDTIEPLKMAGYNVIVQSLAVNGIESKLSAMERSQAERDSFGHCRWINFDLHDQAHDNLPLIVDTLEKNALIDCSQVYIRGLDPNVPELIYSYDISGMPNSFHTQNFNNIVFENSGQAILQGRIFSSYGLFEFDERMTKLKKAAINNYEMGLLNQLETDFKSRIVKPAQNITTQPNAFN